jgi:hypothetical protein
LQCTPNFTRRYCRSSAGSSVLAGDANVIPWHGQESSKPCVPSV